MRTFNRLVLAYFGGVAACSSVRSAHAEDLVAPPATPAAASSADPDARSAPDAAPSPVPAPPDPIDARGEHVRLLRLRAEELDAEAEVERARARLKTARGSGSSNDASSSEAFFRPGRVLLSNIGGVSFAGALGGVPMLLYSVGPFAFSHGASDTSEITAVSASPSVDVVVGKHFTLGGTVSVAHARSRFTNDVGDVRMKSESESTSFDVTPRIGVVERLGSDVWVWPRLAAHVGRSSFTFTGTPETKTTSFGATLDVPFVFPLSRWVFLQVAPFASYTHLASTKDASGFEFGSYARLGLAL